MLTNDNVSLNNLISVSSSGISVATFPQIKEALITQYKFIYGTDIDVDETTADGIFINTNALIINNILQTMQSMYSNLDIHTASGKYLDILCALSNIERKPATRSNAVLQITYLGEASMTYPASELRFVDRAGVEWEATENYSFSKEETKNVYVECRKIGPVTAPKEWIYQTIDATLPFVIVQNEDANIGQEAESDFNLRHRQTSSGSGAGTTTLSSLESKLLAVNGVQDVLIFNNYQHEEVEVDDSTKLSPHSIYVVLRQQEGITILDSEIGNIIYSKLTPGICTVESTAERGLKKSYEYVTDIYNVTSSSLGAQNVFWKVCEGFAPRLDITLTPYPFFTPSEFESIANSLMTYFNSLKIGETPTTTDILLKTVSVDPRFKGSATYYVDSVTIASSTNPLEFFNYTDYSYVESEGKYILTLS